MADGDVRKGTKRPTSERQDHDASNEFHCEGPRHKLERLEAKRCRVISDIYNSDTGVTAFVWLFPV